MEENASEKQQRLIVADGRGKKRKCLRITKELAGIHQT